VWVPPSNGIRCETDGSWSVAVPTKKARSATEKFDAVVIAHNGKCAERLTSGIPAREVHTLLRTNFAASLPSSPQAGAGKFTLNQVYSLVFELPAGVMPTNFDAAFIETDPHLRWLSSNSSKFRRDEGTSTTEVWTVLSTALFGNRHKVAQEALEGTDKEVEVISLLFRSVERVLGLSEKRLQGCVAATKLQLWGAALPINKWASKDGVDFVWSGAHKIGVAGDWFAISDTSASSVEAAWLSGTRLADHIAHATDNDAGIELGENGGRFCPVDGDFGTGGSDCSTWVAEPGSHDSAQGKGHRGYGKSSAKGNSKGKNGHISERIEQKSEWGREGQGWKENSGANGYQNGWEDARRWVKGGAKGSWKGAR